MKKRDIVKSKILFNEIIQNGKRKSNKYYVICSVKSESEFCQFGLAVGKKVGNAVTRNRIKRQLRSIIDTNYNEFSKYHKYIIICKKEVLNLSYINMEKELLTLIKGEKANEK